jgi:hypothetical protein
MGCCLLGCFRLLFVALWRLLAAALFAVLLARVDEYLEGRGGPASQAWRVYRSRGGKGVRRGKPKGASSAIDTEGKPRPNS